MGTRNDCNVWQFETLVLSIERRERKLPRLSGRWTRKFTKPTISIRQLRALVSQLRNTSKEFGKRTYWFVVSEKDMSWRCWCVENRERNNNERIIAMIILFVGLRDDLIMWGSGNYCCLLLINDDGLLGNPNRMVKSDKGGRVVCRD